MKAEVINNEIGSPLPARSEEKQSSSSEQKNSMSKEQLLNEFFMLERRVEELEDMTLKQQKEVTGEIRFALPNINAKISLVEDLPEKIQIHQDEIERLKKENKQLVMENRKLRRNGR
jgi:uncharacterized small protein (DUF1192 family)